MTARDEIAAMLNAWTAAVRAHDMAGAVHDRSDDIRMFDVPEPLQCRGIDAYRDTWTLYFGSEGSRLFALQDVQIEAGADVAWVSALLRCTTAPGPEGRLTLGLRRAGGRWQVAHEHHSFPVAQS